MACVTTQLGPAQAADGGRSLTAQSIWRALFARPPQQPTPPKTAAKIAIGAKLFSDTRLSGDGTRSCATCHESSRAFTDGLKRAASRSGRPVLRHTPSLLGIAHQSKPVTGGDGVFDWDGRATTLQGQLQRPIASTEEMAGDWPALIARLNRDKALTALFVEAFPDRGLTRATVADAIAAYVSSLIPPRTAFDEWIDGDDGALSDNARAGFAIFTGRGQCVACHFGYRLTDNRFHDIGISTVDPGRAGITGKASDKFRFKTPTLRQIAQTAPYMHDGSKATLDDVIRHYERGGIDRPTRAETMPGGLELNDVERRHLIAFLKTL